jgi:hypothetical protein
VCWPYLHDDDKSEGWLLHSSLQRAIWCGYRWARPVQLDVSLRVPLTGVDVHWAHCHFNDKPLEKSGQKLHPILVRRTSLASCVPLSPTQKSGEGVWAACVGHIHTASPVPLLPSHIGAWRPSPLHVLGTCSGRAQSLIILWQCDARTVP